MRITTMLDERKIIGEDISGYCIKVYVEGRKDLGTVIIYKSVENLLPGELEEAGKLILGREIEEDYGTFILLDNKLILKGRSDLGSYEVEDKTDIRKNLYQIYCDTWKKPLEQERKRLEKLEKSKETVKNYALI